MPVLLKRLSNQLPQSVKSLSLLPTFLLLENAWWQVSMRWGPIPWFISLPKLSMSLKNNHQCPWSPIRVHLLTKRTIISTYMVTASRNLWIAREDFLAPLILPTSNITTCHQSALLNKSILMSSNMWQVTSAAKLITTRCKWTLAQTQKIRRWGLTRRDTTSQERPYLTILLIRISLSLKSLHQVTALSSLNVRSLLIRDKLISSKLLWVKPMNSNNHNSSIERWSKMTGQAESRTYVEISHSNTLNNNLSFCSHCLNTSWSMANKPRSMPLSSITFVCLMDSLPKSYL